MSGPLYTMETAQHAAGTAKTHDAAAETLANINFVKGKAEEYKAANAGNTANAAVAHMDEIIMVCNQEQQRLQTIAEALGKNGGLTTNTDAETGSGLFTGYQSV